LRRIRALGGQTTDTEPAVDERPRPPAALAPPPTREEEAILIAERLAALVESRRAGSPAASGAASTPTNASPGAADSGAVTAPDRAVEGARHSGRLLGNLLLTRGFIVESELRYALSRQATTGDPIGQILVDLGLITDQDLVELLAEQLRMQVIDPARVVCDREMLARLPEAEARRLGALPIRLAEGQIDVAIADPSDDKVVAELMSLLGGRLRLFLATRAAIDAAIDRLYS
jgi:Type II secretion system (T2SS), protein E, N-terminal domain